MKRFFFLVLTTSIFGAAFCAPLEVPRVHQLADRYRVYLDAPSQVPHYLIEKSAKKIWVRFVRGETAGSQILEGDQVIKSIDVLQKNQSADVVIKLGPDAVSSDIFFEEESSKVIVDIMTSPHLTPAVPAELSVKKESPKVVVVPVEFPQLEKKKVKPVVFQGHSRGSGNPVLEPVVQRKSETLDPRFRGDDGLSVEHSKITSKPAAPVPSPVSVVKETPLIPAIKVPPVPVKKESKVLVPVKPEKKGKDKMLVVIDAGHGGIDSGAIGVRGTMEKDINLDVAKELARQLEKEKNVDVVLTRSSDEFISLAERTRIANKLKADLFISVHCNASLSSKATGFEVYFLSLEATDKAAEAVARLENSVISLEVHKGDDSSKLNELLASMAVTDFMNESSRFSSILCRHLKHEMGLESAEVKEANFFVLRGAQMPAVLLELEYLSNPISEMKLRSSRYQNKIVRSVIKSVLVYRQQHLKKS